MSPQPAFTAVEDGFDVEVLGDLAIKGLTRPIPVVNLLGTRVAALMARRWANGDGRR